MRDGVVVLVGDIQQKKQNVKDPERQHHGSDRIGPDHIMKMSGPVSAGDRPIPPVREHCQKNSLQHKPNLGNEAALGITGEIHAGGTNQGQRHPYIYFTHHLVEAKRPFKKSAGEKDDGAEQTYNPGGEMNIEGNVPEDILLRDSFFRQDAIFATVGKIQHGVVRQQERKEDQRHPKKGSREER